MTYVDAIANYEGWYRGDIEAHVAKMMRDDIRLHRRRRSIRELLPIADKKMKEVKP